jgi:hypothetical protein
MGCWRLTIQRTIGDRHRREVFDLDNEEVADSGGSIVQTWHMTRMSGFFPCLEQMRPL